MSGKVPSSVTSQVSPWLRPLLYFLGCRLILPLYFRRIWVRGQEYLPETGPLIIAPTHRSRWDGLIVAATAGRLVTGRDLRFMVSANEMEGLQGWIIRHFGGFPVDTLHPAIASLRHGIELLQIGEPLVIFPEGNIFRERQIQPLKPGLARLAIQAEIDSPGLGVKIMPMLLEYGHLMPQWGDEVWVQFGPPLPVSGYCTRPTKKAAQKLTTDLAAALNHLVLRPPASTVTSSRS